MSNTATISIKVMNYNWLPTKAVLHILISTITPLFALAFVGLPTTSTIYEELTEPVPVVRGHWYTTASAPAGLCSRNSNAISTNTRIVCTLSTHFANIFTYKLITDTFSQHDCKHPLLATRHDEAIVTWLTLRMAQAHINGRFWLVNSGKQIYYWMLSKINRWLEKYKSGNF